MADNYIIKWWNPILEALRDMGGAASPQEVTEWVIKKYNIPEKEYTERYKKSGKLVFDNQLRWTRNYLAYEGLISKEEYGIWKLTPKGWEQKELSDKEIESIHYKWAFYFRTLRKEKSGKGKQTAASVEKIDVEELPDASEETISLLDILRSLSPYGFEKICGRLLREYGFEDVVVTQRSRDGGIDGYAKLRLNPFINMNVCFQCKRYNGSVPVSEVRDFGYTVKDSEKGIFITTGYFPESAREIERKDSKLELIDGEKLVRMFEDIKLGVIEKTVYQPDISFFEQYKEQN